MQKKSFLHASVVLDSKNLEFYHNFDIKILKHPFNFIFLNKFFQIFGKNVQKILWLLQCHETSISTFKAPATWKIDKCFRQKTSPPTSLEVIFVWVFLTLNGVGKFSNYIGRGGVGSDPQPQSLISDHTQYHIDLRIQLRLTSFRQSATLFYKKL